MAVVVRDINHNLPIGGVVFNARNTAAVLGNEVSVCTCGVEYQLLIAADGGSLIQVVDRSGDTGRHGGIAIMAQGKVEGIRVVPVAAIQLFFDPEQFFGFWRVRFCVVGVLKLGFAVGVVGIAVSNLGIQFVVGIQRNLDGGGDIIGIGHAVGGGTCLADGVGVSTRLFVGDFTEIGGLIDIVSRYFDCFVIGHRGIAIRLKGKGERVTLFPATAVNALAYAQRGFGCTCKDVFEGQAVAVYGLPRTGQFIPRFVGGRDGQGVRWRTLGRNNSLNQILILAVMNIILLIFITCIFGKQVMIGVTTVCTQRVGDICKGNCAIRIVDGACHTVYRVVRHGGSGIVWLRFSQLVCGFEFEVELTVGQIHRMVGNIFVDFLGLNIECLGFLLKGVGKRDTLRMFVCCVITEYMHNNRGFHFQLAAAVVRDGNRHTVERAVIRNTCNLISDAGGDILGDVVHISAGFIEGDTSEVKGDFLVGAVSTRHIPAVCIAFAIRFTLMFGQRGAIGDSLQFEAEFIAAIPITARQNLYAAKRVIAVIRFHGNRGGGIGVCHRNFFGCTCRDFARAVRNLWGIASRRSFFRDGIGAARGQTHNLGSLVGFQRESFAALDGFSSRNAGNGILVLGIGVQVLARQRKLHRKFGVGVGVRGQTLGGFHLLSNLQAACGVHGQLTVVAKVQHTLVCVKIPLEVNAAVGGAGLVARITIFIFLLAQLVINGGGQAAFFGARLDVAFAIFCNDAITDFRFSCNANGHIGGLGKRSCMIVIGVQMQIVQLVVVGLVR